MRTILARFHTEEYREIANISIQSAMRLAHQNNMTFLDQIILPEDGCPHMAKVEKILKLFDAGFDRVVYADVDVIFRKDGLLAFPPERDPFAISVDHFGWCTGFFYATPTAAPILTVWRMLGPSNCYGNHKLDQGTFRLLFDFFPWVSAQVKAIPEELVSNPESKEQGSLAVHWWINTRREEQLQAMRDMAAREA